MEEVKSHRQRYSRRRFNQIMISDDLRSLLDGLKTFVAIGQRKKHRISYSDVIIYLIKKLLEKDLKYNTKSYSFNFPTRKTSFTTETKSFSFNFGHS